MKYDLLQNDEAVSPILGAILILAISVTVLTNLQINFVPVWNAQEELNHLEKMGNDFRELKSSIDGSSITGASLSSSLSMGFKYSSKIIAYNPRESAYATFSIQNDTWAEVRYNEMLPEGMDDATSIKNISTSTITYSLHGTQNLSSFIYEHGMIRRGGSDYTGSVQNVIANGTVYLLGVDAAKPETITGVEKRTVNIYPVSQPRNSVIGKNIWLILHTRYADWWTNSNNPSGIQKQGGVIKKIDQNRGIIIAYFDSAVIRMGETQITALSRNPPYRSVPYRLVKATQQNVHLPIEGITSLAVEVQDYYNNPVPNMRVNFSINTTRTPSNAFSTATLLQNSAISGADGRANVRLRTSGPGMYYIDASIANSYNATFAYPATSQAGFISLSFTEAIPDYNLTAVLKDGYGAPLPFEWISFASSDGTVTPYANQTDSNGVTTTTLSTGSARGIEITNIKIPNLTTNSALVTWDTRNIITFTANRTPGGYIFNTLDIPTSVISDGCVDYGTSPGDYPYFNCSAPASSHSVLLKALTPYTVYYFIVNSSKGGAKVNSSEYMFVTEPLTDTTPPASVTGLMNDTYNPLYIGWNWTDPADTDLDHIEVYIDGTLVNNVTKGTQYYGASYFRPNSTHEISTRTVDASGNVNASRANHTANTSSVFTYVLEFLNTMGTITNQDAAKNDSDGEAFANLTEEATNATTQYNWSFAPPIINNGSWTFSYSIVTAATSLTIGAGSNNSDGVPQGSLFANISVTSTGVRTVSTSWRSPNFTWYNGTPALAYLNFSFKVAQFTGSGGTNNYEVFLLDPDGLKKQINKTTTFSGATQWGNFSNNSIYLMDLGKSGNYRLLLNATLSTTRVSVTVPGKVEVRWDNPGITLYTPYRLNITANTTNIPNATTSILQLRYNVSIDNFILQIWNGSAWNNRTTLNDTVMSYRSITLQQDEFIPTSTLAGEAGNLALGYVLVRYVDVNASALQGRLYLDYQRVYST